jgi:biopolymer transport protein ExbB/TolQ
MNSTPQLADLDSTGSQRRARWRAIRVLGIILCLGPVLGFIGLIAGMVSSFNRIENERAPTPADLAQGVHLGQYSMVIGFGLGFVGACLIGVSYVKLRRLRAIDEDSEGWK